MTACTKAFGREDIGATGMAGGVERTISAMDARNIEWKNNTRYVSVMYMRSDLEKEAMRIASQLRRAGIRADVILQVARLKNNSKLLRIQHCCNHSSYEFENA